MADERKTLPGQQREDGQIISEKHYKHPGEVDEAMKAYGDDYKGGMIALDEATNKRLLRKIDLNTMPVYIFLAIQRKCCV